jgi:hypothetical protein
MKYIIIVLFFLVYLSGLAQGFTHRNECHMIFDDSDFTSIKYEDLSPKAALRQNNLSLSNNLLCSKRIFNMVFAFTPEVYQDELNSNPDLVYQISRQLLDSMNMALENSNVNLRGRLVHCFVLTQSEGDFINPNENQIDSIKTAQMSRLMSSSDGFWDEVYDHRSKYKASITAVVSNINYGGRAGTSQTRRFLLYGWSTRMTDGIGFTHELGHVLDLEHRRGSFSNLEKAFLDQKEAYGERGQNFSTAMVQGRDLNGTTPVLRYSDPNVVFPDGTPAGGNYEKAAERAQSSTSLARNPYSDEQRLPMNLTIDYALNNNSYTLIEVRDNIILTYGFEAELGSSFKINTGV